MCSPLLTSEIASNERCQDNQSLNLSETAALRGSANSYSKNLILLFLKLFYFKTRLNRLIIYPDIWRKSNNIPVHRKNDKQRIQNYRPIPLLPTFGKIFEKVVFNRVYNFLWNERLLNPNQSGFRPSDSWINQLLAITHEILESFDCNPSLKVRSVFLDIFSASDWHKGLLYKLKSMGISGELYELIENYLSGRCQSHFKWTNIMTEI